MTGIYLIKLMTYPHTYLLIAFQVSDLPGQTSHFSFKRNARVLRTGSGQNGPAYMYMVSYGSEPLSSPALVDQRELRWGKLYERTLDFFIQNGQNHFVSTDKDGQMESYCKYTLPLPCEQRSLISPRYERSLLAGYHPPPPKKNNNTKYTHTHTTTSIPLSCSLTLWMVLPWAGNYCNHLHTNVVFFQLLVCMRKKADDQLAQYPLVSLWYETMSHISVGPSNCPMIQNNTNRQNHSLQQKQIRITSISTLFGLFWPQTENSSLENTDFEAGKVSNENYLNCTQCIFFPTYSSEKKLLYRPSGNRTHISLYSSQAC